METYAKLERTIKQLGLKNVTALRKALDRQSGEVSLWASRDGHDAQQSIHRWPGMEWVGGEYSPEKVEAAPPDLIADEARIQGAVAFVKIDVEGLEASVLQGAQRLLAADHPPILLGEFNRPGLEASGSGVDSLFSVLGGFEHFFVPRPMINDAGLYADGGRFHAGRTSVGSATFRATHERPIRRSRQRDRPEKDAAHNPQSRRPAWMLTCSDSHAPVGWRGTTRFRLFVVLRVRREAPHGQPGHSRQHRSGCWGSRRASHGVCVVTQKGR